MEVTSRACLVNGVTLNVLEAGPPDGPLVILLHGFPNIASSWKHQTQYLAQLGYHVIAPDQRGYNQSAKPKGIDSYDLDVLADDVAALADLYGAQRFRVLGHDWGGIIGWWCTVRYPKRVEQLVVINAPHPDIFPRYLRTHWKQLRKSRYALFFQLPRWPERKLRPRNFTALKRSLNRGSRPGTFTPEDLEEHTKAWSEEGALTAMVNYYRAIFRRSTRAIARVHPPTLLIWGIQDKFLEFALANTSLEVCDEGQGLYVHDAEHWVHLEEPDRVNSAVQDFFGRLT